MKAPGHISHYFEKEVGPLLSICDLNREERKEIIEREKDAPTSFNRFSYGEEFFDFRQLADDLLIERYEEKFGIRPKRRPFYGTLGDADVVAGLFREPCKIEVPVDEFKSEELTFMYPDHFHLVSLMKNNQAKRQFGLQIPKDYSESKYPYFGKLMTYDELVENAHLLQIDKAIETEIGRNGWYRYVEAQIWADPDQIRSRHTDFIGVTPESWTL